MQRHTARRHLPLVLISALTLFWSSIVPAQQFPTKSIRILVPYTPGTQSDIITRIVAVPLSERLKQQVVVENRPGAGATIGITALKAAEPDGHTVGIIVSANVVQPWIRKDMPFDVQKDFVPVTLLYYSPLVMTVTANSPIKTLAEFIAFAKSSPRKLFFSSTGIGTTTHLAGELLAQAAGISMTHVPLKGSPEAYPLLFSGQLDTAFDGYATPKPFVESGRLRVLAVTSRQRTSGLPNVPTIAETYPGFDVVAWTGFAAPAGTPRAAVDRLTQEIRAVLQSPDIRKRLTDFGVEPGGITSAEFARMISDNFEKFGKAIQAAGIKPE